MNTFRTGVSIGKSNQQISLKNPILTAGSCFADAIGSRLKKFKFSAMVNPFGVSYNPFSIHKSLLYSIEDQSPAAHAYLENNQIHAHYDFHSQLSALDKNDLTRMLNHAIESTHHYLEHASLIVITYGTAWVYKRVDCGEIVSNCHKMPARNFIKRLMKEDEIVQSFREMNATLLDLNPNARVIVTVSPVRHLKDGLEQNGVSKAILRAACNTLVSEFNNVEYFPAYELMMDDLRDYRFYKPDMIHPSEEAENYIWEKFGEKYFSEDAKNFIKKWESIVSALNHKAFHPSSPGHQIFLKDTLRRLEDLKTSVDVSEELRIVKSQIL
jgi:hypothetical protein